MRRLRRYGAMALVGLLLVACAALQLKPPTLSVREIVPRGGSLLEQRFQLSLRASNPNREPIAIDGLRFNLEVEGQPLATGVGNMPTVLPGLGEATLDLQVRVQTLELLERLPTWLEGDGAVRYRMRGEVLTRDYGEIPFDSRGELPPRGRRDKTR